MLELPISSDATHFSQEHMVFGQHYLVEFEWIEREDYWVAHLYDASENPIALGLRLMPNWPIFIDQKTGITFLLLPKTSNALLTAKSLRTDFMLVAYAV